jgi:hypothetical protein
MSRDLERAIQGDRSIPWEKAASYFVRVKRASIRKKADLGNPQSMPEGERMGGYGSNYGKIDPGSLISEGVRERVRPEVQQPNIHDAEGMGITPEELEYQRAMARVQEDAELGQIQAENEAAFMEQKLQETTQRAEAAEAGAEQASQQAQQAQQAADQATQQLQATQQEMGAQLQQSQTASMAANEELMRLRQGIQDYRQQLQQLALSDPTAPPAPEMAVDPNTGQPIDPAAAGQQAAPQQAAPQQAAPQPGQEKQSEAVPPMLSPGTAEMPPGMPVAEPMPEGAGPEDVEGQLAEMEDDELMDLLDAVQGEIAARDQEDAEANDAEHQHALGLAESAVAASKTAGAKRLERVFKASMKKKPFSPEGEALQKAVATAEEKLIRSQTKRKILPPPPTSMKQEAFKGAAVRRPFVKTADAINAIPNRRYGISTDHTPGQLEKNSDFDGPRGFHPEVRKKIPELVTKHGLKPYTDDEIHQITTHGHFPHGGSKAEQLRFAHEWLKADAEDAHQYKADAHRLLKNASWGQRAAGAAIGGLAAAGIQGLTDRSGKGGKSDKEVVLAHRLKRLESDKDKGVIGKYQTILTRAAHDTAKTNREHPRAAAAIAALTGATAGALAAPSIVKGVKSLLQHVAKK